MPESASAAKRSVMLPMAPMPFWHIVKVVCSSVSIAAPGEQLGVRCLAQGSHLTWTLPARARIQTHNLGLPRVSSSILYPLGHDCPELICCLFPR